MHGMPRLLLFTCAALALAACTQSTEPTASSSAADAIKLPDNTIPVPIVSQQQDFTCGDVATLALLRFWKHDDWAGQPESVLYGPLMTTRANGTEPYDIATFLAAVPGMHAEYKTGADGTQLSDLEAAIDRREPPIVDVQAWRSGNSSWTGDWSDGHYAVMIGYDQTNLFFMDPSTGGHYGYIPRADLAQRWHDVVGPDGAPTYRMAIFVRGDGPPFLGTPIPPRASPIP